MFLLITLLCLSSLVNAAHELSSVSDYKNTIHPRSRTPKERSNRINDLMSNELQLEDPSRYNRSGKHDRTRRELEAAEQVLRSQSMESKPTTKYASRGLFDVLGRSAKLTQDIIDGTLNLTKNAIGWMTAKTIQIGKSLVEVPLQGIEMSVNAAWAVQTFGIGLTAQMISDTADWFQGNWEAVKAVDFPGKNLIVLLYPSGFMSVVDKVTKEIMYMIDKGQQTLTHAIAYTIYVSLKIVISSVNAALEISQLNCVKLAPVKMEINEKLIESIATESGKACGIAHLQPTNKATITRNDEKFLVVTIPWVLDDLSTHLTGVKVIGFGRIGTILDGEVMNVHINRVNALSTISFEAGTLLRFASIKLRVDSMEGFNVSFPSKEKSRWMESIEALSDRLSSLVAKEINSVFEKVEKAVYDYIAKF